jgi:hypothetical protein
MTDDPDRLAALASPHATVAGKIRALAAAGVPRADIARFLGKRYQHVRNVLEDDAQAGGGYVLGKADLSGVQERQRPFDRDDDAAYIERRGPTAFWLAVKPDGSLPLPKEIAEVLDAEPGRRVFAGLENGVVTIESAETAMNRAREIVRTYVPPGGPSIVDEFLAERRAMWGEADD